MEKRLFSFGYQGQNIDRFRRTMHARVWLNGVDVSSRCFYADGRRGVVRLYVLGDDGRPQLDETRKRLLVEERRGHVRWGRKRVQASISG